MDHKERMRNVSRQDPAARQRKGKMLLVMPLLVIPFLTMAFYALGGGKGTERVTAPSDGLQMALPDAGLKDEGLLNKLSFYEKAERDSAKLSALVRSDPYYSEPPLPESTDDFMLESYATNAGKNNSKIAPLNPKAEKPEEKLLAKLSMLERELNEPAEMATATAKLAQQSSGEPGFSENVDKLETMMRRLQRPGGEDPELKQISSVMDKLLDLQHPERVKQRTDTNAIRRQRAAVVSAVRPDSLGRGFFGTRKQNENKTVTSMRAVVHEDQELVNKSIIKLRLLDDIFINQEKIAAGTFVYGVVSLQGERLQVSIHSLRFGNAFVNVDMEVYDLDGIPGLYVPGAITRDVLKDAAEDGLQGIPLTTLDPSLKAQATLAGLGTVKNLFSRKVKMVRVHVKAGHLVLLKNKTNN